MIDTAKAYPNEEKTREDTTKNRILVDALIWSQHESDSNDKDSDKLDLSFGRGSISSLKKAIGVSMVANLPHRISVFQQLNFPPISEHMDVMGISSYPQQS